MASRARRGGLHVVAPVPQTVHGYLPGIWDMFHIGHLNLLEQARRHCDHLSVGVLPDEIAYAIQGRYPIVPLAERVAIVSAIGIVDEVVVDYSIDKTDAWQRLGFTVLFSGDDLRGTERGGRTEREMAAVGVRVEYFPYLGSGVATPSRASQS